MILTKEEIVEKVNKDHFCTVTEEELRGLFPGTKLDESSLEFRQAILAAGGEFYLPHGSSHEDQVQIFLEKNNLVFEPVDGVLAFYRDRHLFDSYLRPPSGRFALRRKAEYVWPPKDRHDKPQKSEPDEKNLPGEEGSK